MDRTTLRSAGILTALAALSLPVSLARAAYQVQRVVSGLNQPIFMTQAPGDNASLYIVERVGASGTLGKIVKYTPAMGMVAATQDDFLDLGGTATQDGGALGLAFSPDFQTNGLFYVSSIVSRTNHVDEYRFTSGTPTLQRTILQYDLPGTSFVQHTVNWIGFRPGATGAERNNLYITTGDGGIQADSSNGTFTNRGQDYTQDLGKVLRLNVDPAATDAYPGNALKNFAIPTDNPTIAPVTPSSLTSTTNKLGEVFAGGFRNPYRASFDRATGDLYVGDVGFNTWEEVSFLKGTPTAPVTSTTATDFGWARREGAQQTSQNGVGGAQGPSVNPVYQYNHNTNQLSITGGYVYRGPITELQGKYFFADYTSGKIFMGNFDRTTDPSAFNGANLTNVTDVTTMFKSLITGTGTTSSTAIDAISSFAEDNAGNLYVVDFGSGSKFYPTLGTGEIFELVPEPGSAGLLLFAAAGLGLRRRRAAAVA